MGPITKNRLLKICNWYLSSGYFPDKWKLGHCIFLHKKGKDINKPESYRPISLLNITGKVLETTIPARMRKGIDKVIPPFQHGFCKGKGTQTQALRTLSYITEGIRNEESTSVISTDHFKAIDSINHTSLLIKMDRMEMPTNIIQIIRNYLHDRTVAGKHLNIIGKIRAEWAAEELIKYYEEWGVK